MQTKPYYVYMIDTFMSGWGKARNKTNYYVVACDTIEQAETIKRNAELRPEMKSIGIADRYTNIGNKRALISLVDYDELGQIWKK